MQSNEHLPFPRKRTRPLPLRIDTSSHQQTPFLPSANNSMTSGPQESSVQQLSSSNKPSLRNTKKLSLVLPSAEPSSLSTSVTQDVSQSVASPVVETRRRPSVVSLPATTSLVRQDECDSPSVPYADGPVEILPNIWLGSEENARDWRSLVKKGIKSILNVAQEVSCPIDYTPTSKPLRSSVSTPNLIDTPQDGKPVYHPAHVPSGRPGVHYLKLSWSHGQPDLVQKGFPAAFQFVDESLARGDGVLIHCQCGISRSGTLAIAFVMRAAAQCSLSVPAEVWALKDMQGAYSYVKQKSKWVGPNMSLIYQLLDYERSLQSSDTSSPDLSDRSSVVAAEEEEWSRRRAMMDESPSDADAERENVKVAREARALDKAMEDRMLARKSSSSSVASSGLGMGPAWKNRYGGRKRAGSSSSNTTFGSALTEELIEEDESELLGIGGGFDQESNATSPESQSEEDSIPFTPHTARPLSQSRVPPSAPPTKSSFGLPSALASVPKATFDLKPPTRSFSKNKRRPPPLSILPTVPSSPIGQVVESPTPLARNRSRVESRRPDPPPLQLRKLPHVTQPVPTPSQTLFVFPPSPTVPTKTPSTMILTPSVNTLLFPRMSAPRVSTHTVHGKRKSFIGLGVPATPTTAYSRVDARGCISMEQSRLP